MQRDLSGYRHLIEETARSLNHIHVAHCFVNEAALVMQGVRLDAAQQVEVAVQWDGFDLVLHALAEFQTLDVQRDARGAKFQFFRNNYLVTISCEFNTVVSSDVHRVPITQGKEVVWVKSVEYYADNHTLDPALMNAIQTYFELKQKALTETNSQAWNESSYNAWLHRFGPPQEAVQRVLKDPVGRLTALQPFLGDVYGKKVANLMGSHGMKAVACAVLGADVTVVDMSAGNARYAEELAKAAGVDIRYLVANVLDVPKYELRHHYDIVFMELGILHYFIDLRPLFEIVKELLCSGGRFILQDFHPVSTKLITSKGKKHKVTGNYFDQSTAQTSVAFEKYLDEDEKDVQPQVQLRKWTLGEVVTAVAKTGLFIEALREEPNTKADDAGLPKTFTLCARKM